MVKYYYLTFNNILLGVYTDETLAKYEFYQQYGSYLEEMWNVYDDINAIGGQIFNVQSLFVVDKRYDLKLILNGKTIVNFKGNLATKITRESFDNEIVYVLRMKKLYHELLINKNVKIKEIGSINFRKSLLKTSNLLKIRNSVPRNILKRVPRKKVLIVKIENKPGKIKRDIVYKVVDNDSEIRNEKELKSFFEKYCKNNAVHVFRISLNEESSNKILPVIMDCDEYNLRLVSTKKDLSKTIPEEILHYIRGYF